MSGPARLALAVLLALTACATPQERCAQEATRDLRTLRALIAETEATLARGYTYEEELRSVRVGVSYCARSAGRVGVGFCAEDRLTTVRRPVAVDLAAEQRKLDGLRMREAELSARVPAALRACNAQGA